jgi:hypothetical protein
MRATISKYLNDILSLTVMVLMIAALIAGQAGARQHDSLEAQPERALAVDIDFSFRQKGE